MGYFYRDVIPAGYGRLHSLKVAPMWERSYVRGDDYANRVAKKKYSRWGVYKNIAYCAGQPHGYSGIDFKKRGDSLVCSAFGLASSPERLSIRAYLELEM